MHTYLSAAAATAAASNIPALITSGATVVVFGLGSVFTVWLQKRTSRGEARKQIEAVTVELIAAVSDLQLALQLLEPRWNSGRSRFRVLGMAVLEVIAGHLAGEVMPGAMQAVRSTADWNDRAETALVVGLSVPISRVVAALARAVLLADQNVVDAVVKVGEALPVVTGVYADSPLVASRKKATEMSDARAAAVAGLENAIGELAAVARRRMHPPPWWRRAAFGTRSRTKYDIDNQR